MRGSQCSFQLTPVSMQVQLWHEPAIHRDIEFLIADRSKAFEML